MKILLSSATVSALAAGTLGTDLGIDYTAERTLRIDARASLELETTDSWIERDGERGEGFGGAALEERTIEQSYTVLEHAGSAPTRVRRAFGAVTRSTTSEMGDQSFEGGGDGALADVTLELVLEDGEVVAEVVDGPRPHQGSALEGHALTLAFDGLLPDGEVDADERWELAGDAILRALGLDLEDAYFPLEEQPDDGESGRGRGFGGPRPSSFRNLVTAEWEGEATFRGEAEHDGVACFEIGLELEAEGELPPVSFGGGRRRDRQLSLPGTGAAADNTITATLEGRLLLAREGAYPVLFEVAGSLSTVRHNEIERGESTMTFHTEQDGTLEVRVEIAVESSDG